jgi:restriction endonuclease
MTRRRRRIVRLPRLNLRAKGVAVGIAVLVGIWAIGRAVAWWHVHGARVLATLRWAGPLAALVVLAVAGLILQRRLADRRDVRIRTAGLAARTVGRPRSGRNDGKDLEYEVAALLEADGCTEVQVGGGSGDRTLDVFGVHPTYGRVGVQCKDYTTSKVGSQKAQEIIAMIWTDPEVAGRPADINVAMVVTTNYFTAEALTVLRRPRLIERNGQIIRRSTTPVDRDALTAWRRGTWRPLPLPSQARQEVG